MDGKVLEKLELNKILSAASEYASLAQTKDALRAEQPRAELAEAEALLALTAEADAALFTSASTVRGFAAAFGGPVVKTACCIGRQTAEEAAKQGFEEIRTADKATLDSLIKTLEVDEK